MQYIAFLCVLYNGSDGIKKKNTRLALHVLDCKEVRVVGYEKEMIDKNSMNSNIPEPLISLIVPVYNVAEYLETCLQSIMNQTYKNLEIIVVDDGSDDGSSTLCDGYARQDQRIKVIHLPHGGVSMARNAGLDMATGEFLGFVDSDDWIETDMYEMLYTLLVDNNADVSACSYYLDQRGKASKVVNDSGELYVFSKKEIIRALVKNEQVKSYLWAKLFKRSLFDRLTFPVGRVYEDVAVLYKVFYASQKVVMIGQPKYHYMIHKNNSITRGGYDPVNEYHYFLSLYEQDRFVRKENLSADASVGVLKRGIHLINHTLLFPPSPAYDDIIQETMKKMCEYDGITAKQLGITMAVKRYLLRNHFVTYSFGYKIYRSIFKRRFKLLID